jgi:signal transduction histidine kinase
VSAESPPAALNAFETRVGHEHFRIVSAAIRRLPVAYLLMDGFAAWLVWRAGSPVGAVLWFAGSTALHFARWALVRRWTAALPADVLRANRLLAVSYVLLGVWRALFIGLMFWHPLGPEHYVMTVLCLGIAAGAVSTSGWDPRVFGAWAACVGLALAAGWLLRGGLLGAGIAVLTIAFMAVLLGHTRDQRRAMRELVRLAFENEALALSLRVERDRAEAASQSKTRFFAAASHDLRQPLHALSINATTLSLLAGRQPDPMIRELSDSINRALRQSNGLLDGLLDISRLDAGVVQPNLRDVDLVPLLEGVRDEHAPVAAQQGIGLVVELPLAPLAVRTDPDLLLRILNNLLSNAFKFTERGEVRLRALAAPDGTVALSVIDTGRGIPAAERERVFEEFYQIGNASRDRSRGLGLGLSIVRRIAQLLSIRVGLESTPGRGTRIDLALPAGAIAAGTPAEVPALAPAGPLLPGLRVLAIDDEQEILQSLRGLLVQLGCEVRCADGREAAVRAVHDGFRPEVVVADHRLRGHTGLDAIAAVCAVTGPLPALVVTGDTAPQTLQAALAGGYRVIHKPVDGARLALALSELRVVAD